MKQVYLLLYIFLSISYNVFSQITEEKSNGLFYKFSLSTTLRINEDYIAFDNESDETLIQLSAYFINNTIGYQFDKRASLGLNFEYNWHSEQGLHFLPAYLSFQYNLIVNDSDLFIRGGYGSLLGISNDFEKGSVYKAGFGCRIYDGGYQNSFLIGLDFTRKRFGYRTLEGLSSISIFLEFMLF